MEPHLFQACRDGDLSTLKELIATHGLTPSEMKESSGLTPLHLACKHGHLNIIHHLINEQNCNPEATTPNGRTPLHLACKSGHLHIARCLITHYKCNPHCTDNDGYTPLHAVSEGDIAKSSSLFRMWQTIKYVIAFLKHPIQTILDPTNKNTTLHGTCQDGHPVAKFQNKFSVEHGNVDDSTPLHSAAINGHLAVVKYLITELGCNPQVGDNDGLTPLHYAALNGYLAVVKYLISELGCNPQVGDNDGLTPLHYAALNGCHDIVKFLVSDCSCNPQCCTVTGNTPLHSACQNGHLKIVKHLVSEHKSIPERGNVNGYTPLHSAASNGHLAVVKYLISELGCNPRSSDNDGFTPLYYATLNGHLEVAKCLFNEHKSPEHDNGVTPLHSAAINGHLVIVKFVISELGYNPQIGDNDSLTPLHYATLNGHLAVVKFFLSDCSCDPQCCTNIGFTPLHYACQNDNLEIAKYLIKMHKCSPEHASTDGCTPLHSAARNGHLAVVKYLISELGCNPQIGDNDGLTPLYYAILNRHTEVAKYLGNEHKSRPQDMHGSMNGFTLLHLAASNGHLAVVKYLINDLSYNPQVGDNDGLTPLHYAALNGHNDLVKFLISDCNCNPQCSTKKGFTPFYYACENGHLEVAKYLITDCHCNPEPEIVYQYTPLHSAARNGHLAVVEYLTNELGCNPHIADKYLSIPLHYACSGGHLNTVKFLTSVCNCNVECTDCDGATPLHYACKNGNLEVAVHLITECKFNPDNNGCDPKIHDSNGLTPLHCAADNGHLHIARYLIGEHNCNPQCVDNCGTTPLHLACNSGHLDVVKYLTLDQNCACDPECSLDKDLFRKVNDANEPQVHPQRHSFGSEGFTPLHFACMRGNTDIATFLINTCGCNFVHPTNCGFTPFDFAQIFAQSEVVNLVSSITVSGISRSRNTSVQRIAGTMAPGYSLEDSCANMVFNAPLHMACYTGNLEAVKLYINHFNKDPLSKWIFDFTPLHIACRMGHLEIAKYLVTECGCDPTHVDQEGATPLHGACAVGKLEVVKYLVTHCKCNPTDGGKTVACAENLPSLLFTSCLHGHLDIAKFLIEECGCDPHYTDENGLTPLHGTCADTKNLLMKDHNQNFENITDSNVANIKERGMLYHFWQIVSYPSVLISQLMTRINTTAIPSRINTTAIPSVLNSDILQITTPDGQLRSRKFDTFKYLIVEQKCKAQCRDMNGQTPLHYACASGQLDIVKYTHREELCDLVYTTFSGDTPLHIACKSSQVEITELLLSTGKCDPLCKNAEGMTPLEIASSVEIRELLDYFCKGNYPLESVVKVFVLGDPQAGKSSLVQALQSNPSFINSLIGRFQKVKGVRPQTAGIHSLSFRSCEFGNVVIYDFAGQREFLTSHAAFLQNSSSQLAGIFVIVINIAQCENDICHSLQYWVSFILECCAHSEMKPHIIFVGSHADLLHRGDVGQVHSLVHEAYFSTHASNMFYKPKGIVHMDCTRPVSPVLDLLRYHLEESCNSIREHAGKIDQRCYVLHRYVWKFYTSAGVQGHTLESISEDLEGNSYLLPSNPTELLPLFQTLHDKGQALLLKNYQNLGKSWVITDIAAVLERVIGSIFAPHDFPTHTSLGSTGIVARSRIREVFPDFNTDMIIGFLEHFEFCHQLEQGWIDLSELEQSTIEKTDNEFYLFPALITSERPLHGSHESSYCSGWLIHSVEHQFFTTRFLHVLLLRLAFLFSQLQDDAASSSTNTEGPAVKCKCKIWRNGITWLDKSGISSLLEVRSLKTVVLSMTCLEDSRIHCVRLRSQLIQTILKSKHEFCPRVLTEEFIVDVADNILLEVVDEFHSYSINDLSRRISERSAKDNPDLMLMNSDGSQGKQISELLNFEPYALLNQDLITILFSKETAKQYVSDDFISELAQWMYPFHDALVRVLKPSSSELNKKYKDICDSLDEVSKQQLMCEHIIKTWVEQQQRSATYRNLRRQLDRYSIFCGRNPLNLVCACTSAC